MPEEIEQGIVKLLKELGYKDVDGHMGMVYYTDKDGQEWSIEATILG